METNWIANTINIIIYGTFNNNSVSEKSTITYVVSNPTAPSPKKNIIAETDK